MPAGLVTYGRRCCWAPWKTPIIDNDEFVPFGRQFVDDDVGQSYNDPFVGIRDTAGMPDVREMPESFDRGEDTSYDAVGLGGSILGNPSMNFIEIVRRRRVEDDPHAFDCANRAFTAARS